jgi:hypothetical protein
MSLSALCLLLPYAQSEPNQSNEGLSFGQVIEKNDITGFTSYPVNLLVLKR